MKVRCIDAGDIKNLENGKIYPVKTLYKKNIQLLDEKAKAQYSLNRFVLVQYDNCKFDVDIPLTLIINKLESKSHIVYRNKKVIYDINKNKYLISYRDKLDGVISNEVYQIKEVFSNQHGNTIICIKCMTSHSENIFIGWNDVHQNFYQLSDDDALSIMRKRKIENIKNRI